MCSQFRYLAVVLSGCFVVAPYAYGLSSGAGRSAGDAPIAHPETVYPQIVRLSYVEGDVRLSRGKQGEKASGSVWAKAAVGVPLETGFSVVTGKGRAEIELEDASVVYVGENTVVVCNELSTRNGVPRTDLGLLTGVATVNVRPMVAGEWIVVRTPRDSFSVRYPEHVFVRVNSYLDGIGVTAQDDLSYRTPAMSGVQLKGRTLLIHDGRMVYQPDAPEQPEMAEWDKWVKGMVEQHAAATAALMKEAGLKKPIPGLEEMQGQGRFFACAPYGTCWEPNRVAKKQQPPAMQGARMAGDAAVLNVRRDAAAKLVVREAVLELPSRSGADGSGPGGRGLGVGDPGLQAGYAQTGYPSPQALYPQTGYPGPQALYPGWPLWAEDSFFPCSPWQMRYWMTIDPATGSEMVLDSEMLYGAFPWEWAVCHSGSWIERGGGYAWVAGGKRHHRCPVRWVKYGGKKGYVPVHPRDVPGKPPINLKNGLFEVKKNNTVERIAFDKEQTVKVLEGPPKEFARMYVPRLERAEAPRMEAHALAGGPDRGLEAKGTRSKDELERAPGSVPIRFDSKRQSFSVAQQVASGGKTRTVTQVFAGAGTRGGGGGGGWRGGGMAGPAGGSRGGSSGGGISRGGGGGGGGGSHGGSMSAGGGGGGGHSGGGGGGSAAGSHK